jgi:hypothetical protein
MSTRKLDNYWRKPLTKRICIEQYINFDKSIDILVYRDEKLLDYYHDCPYRSIDEILKRIKEENEDAVFEHSCSGELCTGGWIRWEIN